MKNTLSLFALLMTIIIGSSFTTVDQRIGDWRKLGSKKVSYKLDRDVLKVGLQKGTFTKLKVVVTHGNLNMHKMIVEYGNGTKDVIPLKHNFKKGSDTRVIDLEGGNRKIKDITFWYDSKNNSKKRAAVTVFGKK